MGADRVRHLRPHHAPAGRRRSTELYEGRLALLRKADAAGFRGYHLAEHHGHGLSATPSQALFLAAVARETERLRLGLLVACLPLHHPIRLVEEICMLDQLSGGRVDLGVGRGISPFEHRLFGHDPDVSRERFAELLPMVRAGSRHRAHGQRRRPSTSTSPRSSCRSSRCSARTRRCGRRGTSRPPARNGLNVVSGMPVTAETRRRYDELWAESRRAPDPLNPHVATPVVGSSQYVVHRATPTTRRSGSASARSTCSAASSPARSAASRRTSRTPTARIRRPRSSRRSRPAPRACSCAGRPETVRDHYVRYAAEGTVNYLVINVPFGDMTFAEAERTLDAFIADVMPAVRAAVSR